MSVNPHLASNPEQQPIGESAFPEIVPKSGWGKSDGLIPLESMVHHEPDDQRRVDSPYPTPRNSNSLFAILAGVLFSRRQGPLTIAQMNRPENYATSFAESPACLPHPLARHPARHR